MTIGTAIFLASLLFGTILLFAITKDRWNWVKITKRLGLALLAGVVIVGGYLGWVAIRDSREAERAQARAQAERAKEKEARICIAGDLPRMEKLAESIQAAVHENMTLEEAKAVTDKATGSVGHIVPPEKDIKERVLIYSLRTQCDSKFYLLVNVRADEKGALRWLRVWAKDPPEGYSDGLHDEFSTDFEAHRQYLARVQLEAQQAAEAARRRADVKRNGTDTDPCAPNLTRDERLQRLARFGKVRQTGSRDFEAGEHNVVFSPFDGSLVYCR